MRISKTRMNEERATFSTNTHIKIYSDIHNYLIIWQQFAKLSYMYRYVTSLSWQCHPFLETHSLLVFKDIFNGLPGPMTWRYVVATTAHVVPTLTPVTLPAWRTSARALVVNHRCHAAILTEVIAHGHCKLFKQRPVLKRITLEYDSIRNGN